MALQRPPGAVIQYPGMFQREAGLYSARSDELLKVSKKTDMIRSLI